MNQEVPFYYSRSFVIIALLTIGPLGMPFLWRSPCFSRGAKWILSGSIVVFSIILIAIFPVMVKKANEYLEIVRASYPELDIYLPR